MDRGPSLTVRPWEATDGDPGRPQRVGGVAVDRLLATRRDAPGALVALRDRRVALTGAITAIGRRRMVRDYVRGRARAEDDRALRAWLAEVATILERLQPGRDRPTSGGRSAARRSRSV
jgi:hypothetical protein